MIPVCEPFLDGNEERYILDAVRTGWISSSGKYVEKFEKAFAEFCGTKYGISTCNGTVALHLGLTALGIKEGDEVITPNFTMIASAASICYTGAKPVFVDAEKETWNIDVSKIEEKITNRTKAIMPVHIYGHPCDMKKINQIAKEYKLLIIEDSAEAHGSEIKDKKCGSFGDLATFSFYANKTLTTGEGGMVVTDNDELAERCRYFRDQCYPRTKDSKSFSHEDIGFNYRMSNIHAAIGLAQTEKAEEYVKRRIKNHGVYLENLKGIKGLQMQPEKKGYKNSYWMNGILIDEKKFGISARKLSQRLNEKGIGTRPFFKGLSDQPAMKKYGSDCEGNYPISDWLFENGFYLPSGSGLKESEIKYVCDTIRCFRK
jgi:perosamine synthetase